MYYRIGRNSYRPNYFLRKWLEAHINQDCVIKAKLTPHTLTCKPLAFTCTIRFRCFRVRIQFIYLPTVLLKPATANNTDFHFKIPRTDNAWLRRQLKVYKTSRKWEISESATFKLYLIEHCQQGDLLCLTRTCKQFELFIHLFSTSHFPYLKI